MKINILLCDTFPGLLPDYIPSYVSMFTRLFDAAEGGIKYRVFRAMDGQLPDVEATEGLCLITGCNQSVYDDTPWIKGLLQWIKEAHSAKLKLAGICFGHQAVAQALGGEVRRAPQGWGFGIRESRIVDEEAARYFTDGTMRLLYNHHDQVFRLPEEATLVAESAFCAVDSFRIENRILTFQGHPEYVPEYELHLLDNFADDEPQSIRLQARRSIREMTHQGHIAARWILDLARQ